MWHIKYPVVGKVNEESLKSVMPVGYRAEAIDEERFVVCTEDMHRKVGICTAVEGGVVVSFPNETACEKDFAIAFGLKYPQYNPAQLVFGIVYETQDKKEDLYQLDKLPVLTESEVMEQTENYDGAKRAFVVSFYRGAWETGYLQVNSMRKILDVQVLGSERGPKLLTLGNIENDLTM